MSAQKGSSLVLILVTVFLLLGIGSYFYFSKNRIVTSNNNTSAKETANDDLETYSRKLSPWTFKYPKGWHVDSSISSVSVSNSIQGCEKCTNSEKHHYSEFYIQSMGDTLVTPGKSAKQYVLDEEKNFIESERKQCVKGNCLPVTPGYTQKYLSDAIGVFSDPKISVVEVHPYYYSPDFGDGSDDMDRDYLIKKEYVLIVNRSQYTVDTISPPGKDGEVIASILKSLQFN